MDLIDRSTFYDNMRNEMLSGKLTKDQVDGTTVILDFWESPPIKFTGKFKKNWDIRSLEWLAYVLATTYHETARTMQTGDEYGSNAYFTRRYENNKRIAKMLGNNRKGDGAKFHGRGYVQITGRSNYSKMSKIIRGYYSDAPDFTENPDAVKIPEYAVLIMFYGMIRGTFTGKALKHYIGDPDKGQNVDFFNARKIINGRDKAGLIRGYAEKAIHALTAEPR
ncbi:hypothetical protein QUF50_08020 [Thiotrichales bacterium HSG1]|nr:hypothetical protein [Thiotrichales bacterium HSG1]